MVKQNNVCIHIQSEIKTDSQFYCSNFTAIKKVLCLFAFSVLGNFQFFYKYAACFTFHVAAGFFPFKNHWYKSLQLYVWAGPMFQMVALLNLSNLCCKTNLYETPPDFINSFISYYCMYMYFLCVFP